MFDAVLHDGGSHRGTVWRIRQVSWIVIGMRRSEQQAECVQALFDGKTLFLPDAAHFPHHVSR